MRVLTAILAFLCVASASASVTMELEKTSIEEGNSVALVFRGTDPALDNLGLQLPSNLQVIGRYARSLNQDRSVRFEIVGRRPGTYPIGPFTIGRSSVPAVTLTVTPATRTEQATGLFAELSTSNASPYSQERFTLALTIYSESPVLDVNLRAFDARGLEVGNWVSERRPGVERNGRSYHVEHFVAPVRALAAGNFTLQADLDLKFREASGPAERDAFGFLVTRTRVVTRAISTPALELVVADPPTENRPAAFQGDLGQFALEVEASPLSVTVGDPITLKVTLTGKGSITTARPPQITDETNFRLYEPRIVDERYNERKEGGVKVLEQVIIPSTEQVTEIPALTFAYFDPAAGRYKELRKGPIAIEVRPATDGASPLYGQVSNPVPRGENTMLGSDLLYLKPLPARLSVLPSPGGAATVWLGIPALLWLGSSLLSARYQRRHADPLATRKKQAPRDLRRTLKNLQQALDAREFNETLWKGLQSYFSARLQLPVGDVAPEQILAVLPVAPSEDLVGELHAWFRESERAHFSGGANDLRPRLSEFEHFILRWDREVRA